MSSYREVRAKYPHLVNGLEIYRQPAAVVDSIIMKWMLEERAAAFETTLWLRDMLSCGVAQQARLAGALANQVQAFIAGGCTPLLQVTDTDFAQSFKASVAESQLKLRQSQRQAAKLAGVKPTFACGAKEILQIIREAEVLQLARQTERPWVVQACRRNGWLHWRPNLEEGKLVQSSDQSWSEDAPEGCYRLPSRWIAERGAFVDGAGKPLKPQFDEFSKAAQLAASAELEYCREEGYVWKPKCLEDKVALTEEHAVIEFEEDVAGEAVNLATLVDQLPAKQRRRLKLLDYKVDLKKLQLDALNKVKESSKDVSVAKKSAMVLLEKGRVALREKMQTMSREEALRELVMRAGVSKRKKNLKTKPSAKTKPSLKLKPSLKVEVETQSEVETLCDDKSKFDDEACVDDKALFEAEAKFCEANAEKAS